MARTQQHASGRVASVTGTWAGADLPGPTPGPPSLQVLRRVGLALAVGDEQLGGELGADALLARGLVEDPGGGGRSS
jgi:hypothetical protein